ncbi:MAG: hypothetical protein HY769_08035, partial [Candidatus Stahlbacteria bacterium]|nr:hypothetical protein [Candidatus Stahlbacteria bacterium]
MKKWLIFVFCIAIISNIDAKIIHIPADYPTIQEGIDSANVGDTVLVAPGIYYGGISMKRVYLMSEDGPQNTIINV